MGILERCLFQKEKELSSFCLPQCLNVCDPWKYSSCLVSMHECEDDKVTALKGGKCVLGTAPTAGLHHNADLKLTTSQLTVNWNKLTPVCLSYDDLVFCKASSSPSNSAVLSISFLQCYHEKGQIGFLPFDCFLKKKKNPMCLFSNKPHCLELHPTLMLTLIKKEEHGITIAEINRHSLLDWWGLFHPQSTYPTERRVIPGENCNSLLNKKRKGWLTNEHPNARENILKSEN